MFFLKYGNLHRNNRKRNKQVAYCANLKYDDRISYFVSNLKRK